MLRIVRDIYARYQCRSCGRYGGLVRTGTADLIDGTDPVQLEASIAWAYETKVPLTI